MFCNFFIIYFSIYVGVIFIKEKDKGVFKLYKVAKGSWLSLLLSKLVVYSVIIDIFIVLISTYICRIIKKEMNVSVVLLLMLNTMLYIGIMIMAALLISDKNSYVLVVNAIVLFVIILGGGIIPKIFMPDNLKVLVDKLPLGIFTEQLHRCILNDSLIKDLKTMGTYIMMIVAMIIISILCLERRCSNGRD